MPIDGLTAYLYELRNLPLALKAEAASIVVDTAEAAAEEIIRNYPEESKTAHSTGNLRKGVRVKVIEAGQFGAAARVVSAAPHAYLYEHGSNGARKTSQGWNRGAMPAKPTLIPIAIRHRKGMYQKLIELLERRGVEVTGNVAA